jgi:putative Mg2+ transporter-C (MgtC) family protein
MSTTIEWYEVGLRLALAAVAGGLVGLDRSGEGRAAGLRTNLLVCLAAAASMILANLMLSTAGKRGDSFVNIDVMRLPLGVLSGMGFIGAGAIVRRSSIVIGVTTAATLWYVTVMGLCIGAGFLGLGVVLLTLGLVVLRGLKWVENRWMSEQRARLRLVATREGPSEGQLIDRLRRAGYETSQWKVGHSKPAGRRLMSCHLRYRAAESDRRPPAIVGELLEVPGVVRVDWSS